MCLDEPSIRMHHRDNSQPQKALEELHNMGNTVLVVEHDEETIRHPEYVIDLRSWSRPPWRRELVAHGTPQEIERVQESLTGAYISGPECGIKMRPGAAAPNGAAMAPAGCAGK